MTLFIFCLSIFEFPKKRPINPPSVLVSLNVFNKIKSVVGLPFPDVSVIVPSGILTLIWLTFVSRPVSVNVYSVPYRTLEVVPFDTLCSYKFV